MGRKEVGSPPFHIFDCDGCRSNLRAELIQTQPECGTVENRPLFLFDPFSRPLFHFPRRTRTSTGPFRKGGKSHGFFFDGYPAARKKTSRGAAVIEGALPFPYLFTSMLLAYLISAGSSHLRFEL